MSLNNATLDSFISGATLSFNGDGTVASFRFPNSVGTHTAQLGVLPDGYYRAVLSQDDVPALSADFRSDFSFLPGDTDGNGNVNFDDYSRIDLAFNTQNNPGAVIDYAHGDFDYNGSINFDDYSMIDLAFNTQAGPPPSGPGVVSVSATSVDSIHLSWIDNVTGEAGWRVQRSSDGQNFAIIKNLPANTQVWDDNPTTDPEHPLLDGTRYWYRIRAVTPNTAYTPKAWAVTAMKSAAGLTATAASSTAIDLSWTNNSATVTQFYIDRSTDDGATWPTRITVDATAAIGATQQYQDTGLSPGTPYMYRVIGHNLLTDSAPSNVANATTSSDVPPAPPVALTATYQTSPIRIDLDWADNAEPSVGYNVYRSTNESLFPDETTLLVQNVGSSGFSDATVDTGTRYFYTVSAGTFQQNESFCTSFASTITQADAQPTSIVLSLADEGTIDVFWSDQSGNETGYNVYHRGGAFSEWTLAATLPSNATFFTDTGLQEDTEYEYMIDALHSAATPQAPTSQPATTRLATEYRGLVQVFLGLGARPGFNEGMEQLAQQLRAVSVFTVGGELKYRVKLYTSSDEDIHDNGSGIASIDFTDAWLNQGVEDFAILGHSYGGGATYKLADWESVATAPGGIVANLRFTGYVDAIQLRNPLGEAETRRPANSMWHEDYYQTVPGLRGQPVPTANINDEVTNAKNGGFVHHTNIDNSAYVHTQIINSIKNKMPLDTIH